MHQFTNPINRMLPLKVWFSIERVNQSNYQCNRDYQVVVVDYRGRTKSNPFFKEEILFKGDYFQVSDFMFDLFCQLQDITDVDKIVDIQTGANN